MKPENTASATRQRALRPPSRRQARLAVTRALRGLDLTHNERALVLWLWGQRPQVQVTFARLIERARVAPAEPPRRGVAAPLAARRLPGEQVLPGCPEDPTGA